MTEIIFLVSIGGIILLVKYAIAEGQRKEQQKKFMRNMNNFDKKRK